MAEHTPTSGESNTRPCPYCEAKGCEECDGTGQRVTTHLQVDGADVRVSGSAPLSPKGEDAIKAVVLAAYEQMTKGER